MKQHPHRQHCWKSRDHQSIAPAAVEAQAREAGLTVIQDRCLLKEHRRLLGQTSSE